MPPPTLRYIAPYQERLRQRLQTMGVDALAQTILVAAAGMTAWAVDNLTAEDREALAALASTVGARWVARGDQGLLIATVDQARSLARTLEQTSLQSWGRKLSATLATLKQPTPAPLTIREHTFAWGSRTFVMGILNVTPDSFSGDGLVGQPGQDWVERAVAQAQTFVKASADLLDVGGESTRPGAEAVDAATEVARVVPVIRRLREITELPVSIDTYKAEVAAAALDAGADLVNDVWGLQMDPAMAPLVAERQVPVVIMHNRSKPHNAEQEERLGGRYVGVRYDDLLGEIAAELAAQVSVARQAGIQPQQIILDPGIGFGKTVQQNLALINRIDELRVLGYPLLLGPSRKSFIGYTLDVPPEERVEGTLAALVVSILRGGADIVRVHDVQAAVRATRMADAILRAV